MAVLVLRNTPWVHALWFALFVGVSSSTAHAEAVATLADGVDKANSIEGTAVITAGGGPVIMDRGAAGEESDVGLNLGFGFSLAPKNWPVMLGLGAGFISIAASTRPGPTVIIGDAGALNFESTTSNHSLSLRHGELIARIQPFWGGVRPFLEGSVGVVALFESATLETHDGALVEEEETQRSVGAIFGASLGADIRIFPAVHYDLGEYGFLLTLGLRRCYTTPLDRFHYEAGEDSVVVSSTEREPLRLWMPFIGLTFASDTRPEARIRSSKPRSE